MSTEKEVSFGRDEMIISKTDLQGRLTYANRTFMRVANFSEIQLLGQNHNIIRHPSMPRVFFMVYGKHSNPVRSFLVSSKTQPPMETTIGFSPISPRTSLMAKRLVTIPCAAHRLKSRLRSSKESISRCLRRNATQTENRLRSFPGTGW